jgi:hypothetical protein
MSVDDMNKFFNMDITKQTPVVIVDYNNKTTHSTGMLGRTFADALAIELLNTKKFGVVKREDLQRVLDEQNLTLPISSMDALAMIADRLKSPYIITGDIEDVKVIPSREGTYAEVTVNTLVVSRVTKQPINGARVVQRSSPKIGYTGNPDVLVHEALATAAYQAAYRLLDNRLPIATILTSVRNGEISMKGGSAIGLKEGMVLITVRRETVTGRIRLVNVTPNASEAVVIDQRGVAPGDKAVPVYELTEISRIRTGARERAGQQLSGLVMLGLLATWIGTDGGNDKLKAGTTPTAVAIADARYIGQTYGAILVRWQPTQTRKVIAYTVYRDSNPYVPCAVVPSDMNYYIDSATPMQSLDDLGESAHVNIEIDEATGEITSYERLWDWFNNWDDYMDPELEVSNTHFAITAKRRPLAAGEANAYQVGIVFEDYDVGDPTEELGHPEEYRLFVSNKGGMSARVTLIPPPDLQTPGPGILPVDGTFRCQSLVGTTSQDFIYTLQLSNDPTFNSLRTTNVSAASESDSDYAQTNVTLASLYTLFPGNASQTIYWRMGVRRALEVKPVAYTDQTQANWVYSEVRSFVLPVAPPRSARSGLTGGMPSKVMTNSGRDNDRGRLLRRF